MIYQIYLGNYLIATAGTKERVILYLLDKLNKMDENSKDKYTLDVIL